MNYSEEICQQILSDHIQKFTSGETLNNLTEIYNLEQERMNGYHGRELLELIQNVDDAYLESCENNGSKIGHNVKCKIEYNDNILTVANTGTTFTKDTIARLCQGGVSAKSSKYIGNKGTGFRSVLNWSKNSKIEIHSGEFHIRFSKDYADSQFNEIEKEEIVARQIKNKPEIYLPILSCPQDISDEIFEFDGFDTVIKIYIDETSQGDGHGIIDQINDFDENILLFLQAITEVDFIIEDSKNSYKKYRDGNKTIVESEDNKEGFFVFDNYSNPQKIFKDNEEKEIRISVAVPVNYDEDSSYNLYTYFPIRNAKSPFPAILHATFILNQSRDSIDIDSDGINNEIVKELLKFYAQTISSNFAKKEWDDYALKLLTPNNILKYPWKFKSEFGKFGLEEYYFDQLCDERFLPTVNDDYISIVDEPKLFTTKFPDFFKGPVFNKLLKLLETRENDTLVEMIAQRNNIELCFDEEICFAINAITETLTIQQQVEAFAWWEENHWKGLPNLLKDDNDNWVEYNKEYYFLSGYGVKIPKWVKIPLLGEKYQIALFDHYKNDESIKEKLDGSDDSIDRILSKSNKIQNVKFSYRDSSNIIQSVNSSVKDNYEYSLEFVKWLYKNYKDKGDNWIPPKGTYESPVNYRFPALDKTVANSRTLHFENSFENELAKYLFIGENDKAFAPFSEFGLEENEKGNFKAFLDKFGVMKFPKIQQNEIKPDIKYKKEIQKIIRSRESYDIRLKKISIPIVNNFEEILRKSPNWVIIKWILADEKLFNALKDHYEGVINYDRKYKLDNKYSQNLPNYFVHLIRITKWVNINGEKYSLNKCLLNNKNANKFSSLLNIISDDYINDIAIECSISIQEVKEVFDLFDIPEKITELTSEAFYGLLLTLPDHDPSGDLVKVIYREIESGLFDKEFDDCDEKSEYFEDGKIFVKRGNQKTWSKASEAYYPSSKIINTSVFPIVDKSQRSGTFSNFNEVFGIQEYDGDYEIIKNSEILANVNGDFQKYFNEFLRYAKPFGEKNDNIKKYVSQLSIHLVSEFEINENEHKVCCNVRDNLNLVLRQSNTKWFIITDIFDINTMSEHIENIFDNLSNTSGFDAEIRTIGEIFRSDSSKDRDFLINKEFGSLSVLSDSSEHNSIKLNFVEVIKKLDHGSDVEQIKIDWENFESIENSCRIINALAKINVDLEDFADNGFKYTINLIPYWKEQIVKYLNKKKVSFQTKLYYEHKEKDYVVDFQEKLNEYSDYEPEDSDIENSVYFNIDQFCKEIFSFAASESINIDDIYKTQYYIFSKEKDVELLQEFFNNNDNKSLLYFYDVESLKYKLDEMWISFRKKIESEICSENNRPKNSLGDIPIAEISEEKICFQNANTIYSGPNKHNSYSDNKSSRDNKRKAEIGDKGELLAYKKLQNQFSGKNTIKIIPKSRAFFDIGIIAAGQIDDGFGCDIVVEFEDGTEEYYEIKTGNQEFYLSIKEFEFASKYSGRYHLWFITDYDTDNPQIHEIAIYELIENAHPLIEKYKYIVNITSQDSMLKGDK
jgi:hypothetical protein